ncbi:hypothetical protein [Pimelobacter simplex]|uniref:hypothetical protein n=1 Tax=Nocardioides simplex TaxID=2045 RepID=UPI00214F6D04|nr:hypothetical protein [Pimelobacter simplex]UUW89683.1 hypothetical protein M0M43_28735 [Pimelobacter simplex]UUW93512.1 hypothetical protein M0M48_17390 [Pimelobacter simplex]
MSRRHHVLTALAGLLAAALLLVAGLGLPAVADGEPTDGPSTPAATETATETATEQPSEQPTEQPTDDDTAFAVTDAVFRWGVNDESNNRAHAPGTFNFLSAGKAPDPGRGGQTLDTAGRWPTTKAVAWLARSGNVRIEKNTTRGPRLADYAGLKTAADDTTTLGSPTAGTFSNHQVVISGGKGEVDPAAGTATITWTGSFTLFYYSGMTFFTLSNPVLRVDLAQGTASITATASGFASSMEDMTKWSPVPATPVTLVDLQGVGAPQLAAEKGFTAVAKYLKVPFKPADGSAQSTSGAHWGAFPTSFLRFLEKAGSAAYWFSSGGSTDEFKVAKPITVSWDAKTAIVPEKPPATPTVPKPQPTNQPGQNPPPVQPPGPSLPVDQPSSPALPGNAFGTGATTPDAGTANPAAYEPPIAYALTSAPTSTDRPVQDGTAWEWALGILLLLGAAGITLSTPFMNRLKGTR